MYEGGKEGGREREGERGRVVHKNSRFAIDILCRFSPFAENPNCLHTTVASVLSQKSSQTVPHCPPKHTSTRPSRRVLPSTSLNSPWGHSGGSTIVREGGRIEGEKLMEQGREGGERCYIKDTTSIHFISLY